jgi:hypothetical protein
MSTVKTPSEILSNMASVGEQIIIRAVAGLGFDGHVACGIDPFYSIVNKKDINLMPFGMGDLTELKTP